MRGLTKTLVAGLLAVMALLLAACGGDDTDEGSTSVGDQPAAESGGDGSQDSAPEPEPEPAAEQDTGDGEAQSSDDDGGEQAPSSGGGDLSLVPDGETDILGNPAGQGFVELEGVRYDFILNGACQKIFGGVQASGIAADGSQNRVDSIIPPEDWETNVGGWEPPHIELEIGDDSWRAQVGSQHNVSGTAEDLSPDQSGVTSFTNDGSFAAGQANFYSEYNYQELETASGSFEFYCP